MPSSARTASKTASPPRPSTTHPQLTLTPSGDIEDLNDAARRVLECPREEAVNSTFFSYVHGKNLRRVMWDLAQMVNHGVEKRQWLLRLRAGSDRWRWYRAKAQNLLQSRGAIRVHLRPV